MEVESLLKVNKIKKQDKSRFNLTGNSILIGILLVINVLNWMQYMVGPFLPLYLDE